jgi:hypothetical protein
MNVIVQSTASRPNIDALKCGWLKPVNMSCVNLETRFSEKSSNNAVQQ